MIRSLFTAATGMEAQKLNMDVIANNLANVNTVGYKKSRADFQELLYQSLKQPGATSAEGAQIPSGIQVGLGTKPVAVQKIFQQGDFVQTGNPLDLVIEGDGFFQVLMPDGTVAYSRAGAFKMDSDGRIVNSDGYPMEPAITIPANALTTTIGSDGKVTVLQAGSTTPAEIGQIEIAKFMNPGGLQALGKNLYPPPRHPETPRPAPLVSTGWGPLSRGMSK